MHNWCQLWSCNAQVQLHYARHAPGSHTTCTHTANLHLIVISATVVLRTSNVSVTMFVWHSRVYRLEDLCVFCLCEQPPAVCVQAARQVPADAGDMQFGSAAAVNSSADLYVRPGAALHTHNNDHDTICTIVVYD